MYVRTPLIVKYVENTTKFIALFLQDGPERHGSQEFQSYIINHIINYITILPSNPSFEG